MRSGRPITITHIPETSISETLPDKTDVCPLVLFVPLVPAGTLRSHAKMLQGAPQLFVGSEEPWFCFSSLDQCLWRAQKISNIDLGGGGMGRFKIEIILYTPYGE